MVSSDAYCRPTKNAAVFALQVGEGQTTRTNGSCKQAGNGYFYFVGRASGMVLDVSGSLVPNSGAASQKWQIVPAQ